MEGLGTLLNGLYGGLTGSTVSMYHFWIWLNSLRENVGLMGSTRVGRRRVAQISAGFMILFSMLGKLGALFASIPIPMFVAVHCIMFGIVVGLSLMQFTNMNSARSMYIIVVSIFIGLSVSEYFNKYTSMAVHSPVHSRVTWINDFLNTVFLSSSAVALVVALFLDRTLGYNDKPREIEMQWWGRLRKSIRDIRTKLFGVPFNLNWIFPSS